MNICDNKNYWNSRSFRVVLQLFTYLKSIHDWHTHIKQNKVWVALSCFLKSAFTVMRNH